MTRFLPLGAAVALLTAAGCGPKEYQLTGTVKFADGKPLTTGSVVLTDTVRRLGSAGRIGPDGGFATAVPLPAGTYHVSIQGAVAEGQGGVDPATGNTKSVVAGRYLEAATSGLTATLPGPEVTELVVERP